jgi:type IV secretory pathway ATPase VirB11/archaellum biosynthesis ATPase
MMEQRSINEVRIMPSEPIDVGILEVLLADPDITAIEVDETSIHYAKVAQTYRADLTFADAAQRQHVIESIVQAGGKTLSAATPMVDCVLDDGTQVHAEYAPSLLTLHKKR